MLNTAEMSVSAVGANTSTVGNTGGHCTSSLVMPTASAAATTLETPHGMAIATSTSGGGFIIHHPSGAVITSQQVPQPHPSHQQQQQQQRQNSCADIEDKNGIIVNIGHHQQQQHQQQHQQHHPHSQQIVLGEIMDYKDATLVGTVGAAPSGDNHHNYASANGIVVSESADYQHLYQQQQQQQQRIVHQHQSSVAVGPVDYQPALHPELGTMIKHEVL